MNPRVLPTADLARLLDALSDSGHRLVGPTVRDGAITVAEISGLEDLPHGYRDEEGPGHYRLRREGDRTFDFTGSPHSYKRWRIPPYDVLFEAKKDDGRLRIVDRSVDATPTALIGIRACDLSALHQHDQILGTDERYAARRQRNFIVSVGCTRAGETCFCASMGTGPAPDGYDLNLTELDGRFIATAGSSAGEATLKALDLPVATAEDLAEERAGIAEAERTMGRTLDTRVLPDAVLDLDHARWDDVAERCLACTNCTMVCPTCFCSTVEDSSSLDETARRTRRWDSCFTESFSYIHGGPVRTSVRARYRQWLMHKLGTWFDQFDAPGCVGCGRCITWCPVGIDLTEEVRAMSEGTSHD